MSLRPFSRLVQDLSTFDSYRHPNSPVFGWFNHFDHGLDRLTFQQNGAFGVDRASQKQSYELKFYYSDLQPYESCVWVFQDQWDRDHRVSVSVWFEACQFPDSELVNFEFHPMSKWTPVFTKFAEYCMSPVHKETLSAFTTYLNSIDQL